VKRPKGPELKMPTPRVPGFLADLYHDLRDRRLLPLIALVLVAIVATPILLGQKPEATPLPGAGAGAISALKEAHGGRSELTVVEATPGLRAPGKRLHGRKPTDPFRKSAPKASGAQQGGGSGEGAGAASSVPVTSTSATVGEAGGSAPTGEGSSAGGAPPAGSEPGGSHIVRYVNAIDVTIVHSSGSEAEGNKQSGEPVARKHVLPPASLPGEKTQVVTYLGTSPKTGKPLFLVSDGVIGVFGEGHCLSGAGACQLIELEPGFPEVFSSGEGTDRYSIKVTKVELVVLRHP
jgi:hypothetical protein